MIENERRVLRSAAFASALFVTLCSPLVATAQNTAVAESLFQEGKKLMDAGKFAEACPKFAESNRLDPGAGTLTALALCHKGEGKTASAWSEFKEVVSLARRDNRKDREQVALDNINELEPKLSRLRIDVNAMAVSQGVEVRLDGNMITRAAFGVSVPVDPGPHQISATAVGKKPFETTITIDAERADKKVEIPALEDAPRSHVAASQIGNEPQPENRGSTQRTIGYALGGVGIVGIGIGAVFGVQALSKSSESDDLCGNPCSSPEGLKANEDARSAATISNIAIGVGLAALIGGVALILTAPSSSPSAAAAHTKRGLSIRF
jgi:hypothetical protein